MKIILTIFLGIHGLIHLLGFLKAFHLADVSQLNQSISKPAGILWLAATLLFLAAAAQVLAKTDWWWITALLATLLSQSLILMSWQDAKFGTIANLVVLLMTTAAFGKWNFYRAYTTDVRQYIGQPAQKAGELLSEADIAHLPLPVRNYIRYTGSLNREKIRNARICFNGEMRSKTMDWFRFRSEQANRADSPVRLFYMKGKIKGLEVPGYHRFVNGEASMNIRLFGLIPVVGEEGGPLNQAETVTVFNDMCLLMPATLIDKSVKWRETGELSAEATFTCNNISITAQLIFNEKGQLVNFISDDRIDVSGDQKKNMRFSTPVRDYRLFDGRYLPSYGEAIWHYPEGEFVYGRFRLESAEFNVAP